MKSLRIVIEEIDHEDRAKPIHFDMQVVRTERLQNLQLRGMLLKAIGEVWG